ncbi:amino acid deaminase/aldolase [Actinopolymorpha sp. B17G11]|uniref:amino acid deaminase/aldolase n=1 Tax=Actinopolymorpha sp. B17G11 TaxID=3160861 RepID=UPI0032E4BEEE
MAAGDAHDLRARYDAATADLEPPLAIIDMAAFRANADDLVRRAGDTPVRLASKSVRVRSLLEAVLQRPGFGGVLAYSLAEAVWLADHGVDDIVMGYPSVDRPSLRRIADEESLAAAITLCVDDVGQLDFLTAVLGPGHAVVRLCMDIDTSWRPLGLYVGARRSPVRSPAQASELAQEIKRRPGFRLVGVMTYEAQIAGIPDAGAAVRWMKSRSAREIDRRRRRVLDAISSDADLEFVNAGGTGSLEVSAAGDGVTEVTAGSGLFGPTLFDQYRTFRPVPAVAFALPVLRRPGPRTVTVAGGGYPASGPAGWSRLPTPYLPPGLRVLRTEGAGEVQTPLRGREADALSLGSRVWFRPAKAAEICERFLSVHLVEGDRVVATVPTYRGESRAFG